jgi:hypothetical protein
VETHGGPGMAAPALLDPKRIDYSHYHLLAGRIPAGRNQFFLGGEDEYYIYKAEKSLTES